MIEKYKALEADLETERLRLAACGVAALGYFDGCKDEYRSASLEDTLRLYEINKELKAENEESKNALGDYFCSADDLAPAIRRLVSAYQERNQTAAKYMQELNETEAERDELKRQLAEAKLSLTPQEPPEGLVPYGHSLEPTRQNADFWYKAGHSEEAKRKGESVICMAQAVFAWKNAAYAKAEKEMLLENQIAELTEWNNQIGRTNYELRKQLEGEKAAALNYRADALDAEKQLAEYKAENERLNTVPMKYRRMAFNAQLQKENEDLQFRNDRLVQDFADVTEANDALRRIHAENIEIFKRQLAEYKALLSNLMEVVEEPPERNCSCHTSPPCSDCVEWSGLREALLEARTAMKEPQND
jgi:hypothetical protein